jgi:5-formyltetrahydrofolate cyclo-ligase
MLLKTELRRELKKRLKSLPPESFTHEGARAAVLIKKLPLWETYTTLLLFLSAKTEIDTAPLLEAALGDKKRVFAPRIQGDDLVFCPVRCAAGPWEEGPWGIREPREAGAELSPADFPALIIVPGLGFDRQGNRLGRGKGFYDRFLAALEGEGLVFKTLGLCMEAQVVPEIPVEPRDKKMDGVCTGGRTAILN